MLLDCPHCGAHLFRPHHDGCPGRLEPPRDLCVFCGRRPDEAVWMAGEPGRRICDRCVARCRAVLSGELDEADPAGEVAAGDAGDGEAGIDRAGGEPSPTDGTGVPRFGDAVSTRPPPPPPDVDWYGPPRTDRCGYCGRSRSVVHRLIAGPKVAICDTCVYDIAVQRGAP